MAVDPEKARIAVIGAGLMGHGIAQVFALAGHEVMITDAVAASLDAVKARIAANLYDLGEDQSAVERVQPRAALADAVRDADYVVEAVSEDLALKQKLFGEIERHVRADTILASNTSVIPITAIMQGLAKRERALGTHWWNPPFLIPLVEVIETQWTAPQAVAWTMKLHETAGKKPAHVKKDVPGFIGNRLATRTLARGDFAGRERRLRCRNCGCRGEILVRSPPAVLGPLENADLIGTDLTLAIHSNVLKEIESRPGASPYLEKLVDDGKLGFKSGEGFRKWSPDEQAALRTKLVQHLKAIRD